jgi:hypothetical protein
MMIISNGLPRLQKLSADMIAPLVVVLASDASADVTKQIFCVRKNPIRTIKKSDGLTADRWRQKCYLRPAPASIWKNPRVTSSPGTRSDEGYLFTCLPWTRKFLTNSSTS